MCLARKKLKKIGYLFNNMSFDNISIRDTQLLNLHIITTKVNIGPGTQNVVCRLNAEGVDCSLQFKYHDSVSAVFECVRSGCQKLITGWCLGTKQGGKTYLPLFSSFFSLHFEGYSYIKSNGFKSKFLNLEVALHI